MHHIQTSATLILFIKLTLDFIEWFNKLIDSKPRNKPYTISCAIYFANLLGKSG